MSPSTRLDPNSSTFVHFNVWNFQCFQQISGFGFWVISLHVINYTNSWGFFIYFFSISLGAWYWKNIYTSLTTTFLDLSTKLVLCILTSEIDLHWLLINIFLIWTVLLCFLNKCVFNKNMRYIITYMFAWKRYALINVFFSVFYSIQISLEPTYNILCRQNNANMVSSWFEMIFEEIIKFMSIWDVEMTLKEGVRIKLII